MSVSRASLGLLVLGVSASMGMAQVMTPPTDQPEVSPKFKGFAPRQAPTANTDPAVRQQGMPMTPAPAPEPLPTDVAWDMLVKRGSDGKLQRLAVPTERAAFDANPKIDAGTREKIAPYLKERKEAWERSVVANLDLYEKLMYEQLDALDLKDTTSVRAVTNSMKPFTQPAAPGSLTTELSKRNLVSNMQKNVTLKIASEYDKAVKEEDKAANEGGNKTSAMAQVLRSNLKTAMLEATNTLDDLWVEASKGLSKTATTVAISGPSVDAVKALPESASREQRLAAMKKLTSELTLQQRQHLLRTTIEQRGK